MMRLAPVVALALAWSGTASAYELARPMGLYPAGNAPALAMLDSRIDVTVRGPIVEVVVVQRFRNAAEHATEATYIFPLPDDAAISAMAIQVGTRTIRGAIEARDAAQRRYEAAVAAGVAGALLEQERPDVFTQSVAAIPAHGVVEVTLRYDTLAHYQAGSWELVLPMVVAPRYVPGTASGRGTTGSGRAPDTERAPDASRVTPAGAPGAGGSTAIAIHFVDPPSELVSPTHEIAATRSDATLSDPHSDHDAIVRWRSPAPSAGWVEREGDGGFAAIVVEAPPAASPAAHKPLRVILAIDRAATTRGDGDAVERPLVRALCGGLDTADRVRVIGSDAFAWNAPGDVLRALERVWGTSVPVFDLTRVLAGAHPEGAAIVLVSDGLVADDRAAIAAARRLGVAIHVLGIGPAPARATLHQLAAVTGGTERYAVAGDDMTELARAVLADVAAPPAPLTINWGTLGALDIEPAVLPRLGAGQAMLVLARVKRAQAANARTRGELFAFASLGAPRTVDGATTSHGPLARRWARERLDDLVAARSGRAAVVNHALAYGLVSPYTSLVAIGSDVVVSGGVKRSVAVPVSVPSGMHWQAVKQLLERDAGSDAVLDTARAPRNPEPAPPSPETITPTGRAPVLPAPSPTTRPPATPPRDTAGAGDATGARKSGKKADQAEHTTRPPRKPPAADKRRDLADAEKRGGAAADSSGTGEPDDDASRPSKKGFTPAEKARPRTEAPYDVPAKEVATATPRAPISDDELTKLAEAESKTEVLTVTGSLIGRAPQHLRGISLSAALGGGVAFDHGGRSLLSLDVRLDAGGSTRLGGEAALWLVGGAHPQGRGLVTLSTDRLRWLDLSLGAGLHLGDGTGVAGALRLRLGTPLRWLGVYGRYDAALLLTRPSLELEHATSLGLELSY